MGFDPMRQCGNGQFYLAVPLGIVAWIILAVVIVWIVAYP